MALKELRHPPPHLRTPDDEVGKYVFHSLVHLILSVTEERRVFSHCSLRTKGKQMRVTQDFQWPNTTEPFF